MFVSLVDIFMKNNSLFLFNRNTYRKRIAKLLLLIYKVPMSFTLLIKFYLSTWKY